MSAFTRRRLGAAAVLPASAAAARAADPMRCRLVRADPRAATLRRRLLASHTTTEQLGRVAAEAGVKTLVLTHFAPGGEPAVPDEVRRDAVKPHFAGELIVGHDLMEL